MYGDLHDVSPHFKGYPLSSDADRVLCAGTGGIGEAQISQVIVSKFTLP